MPKNAKKSDFAIFKSALYDLRPTSTKERVYWQDRIASSNRAGRLSVDESMKLLDILHKF